jgi:hypothetical protein
MLYNLFSNVTPVGDTIPELEVNFPLKYQKDSKR